MSRLFVVHSSGQTVLLPFDEFPNDSLNPFAILPFAEDHFGEAAALPAMQVHVSIP
jgi:hypothetical protein